MLRYSPIRYCRVSYLLVFCAMAGLVIMYTFLKTKDGDITLMAVDNNKDEISLYKSQPERHVSSKESVIPSSLTKTAKKTPRPASNLGELRFEPYVYNPEVENFTRDIAHEYTCTEPVIVPTGEVEDLMCLPRPKFLPDLKNPCFIDESKKLACLPYFFLLGFDKCGTTDFHSRLTSHPQVLKNNAHMGKETYYWCWRRYGIFMLKETETLSLKGYMSIFSRATDEIEQARNSTNQPVVGEGGPIDMWDFRAWPRDPQNRGLSEPRVITPHHIRHLTKDPKFIVLVRDPVERMYSDYLFLKYGETAEEFDRDVPIALDMMRSCLRVNSTRQCFYSDDLYHKMPMRLHISCYAVFMREWLTVFHRRHFFIIRNEDYQKDMKGTLQAAFSFLGVQTLTDTEMDEVLKSDKKFETSGKKKAGSMSEESRKMLEDFYAPCNAELRNLLKDDKFLYQDTRHH